MRPPLPAESLDEAIRLQNQFWTQERIAERLGVSRETICRALSKHNRKVFARLEKRTAAIKARQVAQLEWLASQSIEAWHRSKQDAETIKQTNGIGSTGEKIDKTETTVKGQSGNPAMLTAAMAALADVRKILALEPKTQAVPIAPGFEPQIVIPEEDDGV